MFQPATEGSSMWRGRKETHVIDRDLSVIFSHYKCSCVDVLYSIHRRITTNGFSQKSKFCFIREFSYVTSLLHFEVMLMCKWWPLLHRIGMHTSGLKVHTRHLIFKWHSCVQLFNLPTVLIQGRCVSNINSDRSIGSPVSFITWWTFKFNLKIRHCIKTCLHST